MRRVLGLGFRVWGLGFGNWGFRVWGLGFWGLGFRALGFMVGFGKKKGLGFRVCRVLRVLRV